MKRVGLVGNFCGNIIGGQAEKTRVLYEFLNKRFDVFKVDIYQLNPIQVLISIGLAFFKCDRIVIILASSGYFKIQPFLILFKGLTGAKIYEFVIGGIRHEFLAGKKKRICREKKISKIYVESTHMVHEYIKLGLDNAVYIPNFKIMDKLSDVNSQSCAEKLRLCTFSRIDKYKGIDTAIEIVNAVYEKKHIKVELDIIGPLDKEYEQDFRKLLANVDKDRIHYVGSIPSKEAIIVLSKYDMLIFPTHWETEGFPGSFIDAMAAGLPILATDKENFHDIIMNKYNGWLINEWDIDGYVEKIAELAADSELLTQMRHNAVAEAEKYTVENALSKVLADLNEIKGGSIV